MCLATFSISLTVPHYLESLGREKWENHSWQVSYVVVGVLSHNPNMGLRDLLLVDEVAREEYVWVYYHSNKGLRSCVSSSLGHFRSSQFPVGQKAPSNTRSRKQFLNVAFEKTSVLMKIKNDDLKSKEQKEEDKRNLETPYVTSKKISSILGTL